MFFYIAIQCQVLNDIEEGNISYNSVINEGQLAFNTEATHTCDKSYILSSGRPSDVRVCGGNDSSAIGMWNGTTPICTGEILLLVITCICDVVYILVVA